MLHSSANNGEEVVAGVAVDGLAPIIIIYGDHLQAIFEFESPPGDFRIIQGTTYYDRLEGASAEFITLHSIKQCLSFILEDTINQKGLGKEGPTLQDLHQRLSLYRLRA